jgi:flagellar P-ring protein precursor FlgI
VTADQASIDIKEKKGEIVMLKAGASLGEVVKALNAVGASPQDLLAILQAMKSAGALKADLEII